MASPWRQPDVPGELLRTLFGNVTKPVEETTILQLTRIGLQAVQALRRCRLTVFEILAVPFGAVTECAFVF